MLLFLSVKFVSPLKPDQEITRGFADAPFGPFAGYVWLGSVHSVGASFTVPQINAGSPLGLAGTWIGVQGQGPPSRFMQIGALEGRTWSIGRQESVDGYYAFWSDVAHDFKAQPLFPVRPGDRLSVGLTLAGERWRLAVTDTTSGRKTRFSIRGGAGAPFDQADWTQEDPGAEDDHVRYPEMTAPVFRTITVNSADPVSAYSSWMSVNNSNLAPTAMHAGSFTLERAPAVDGAGMQYMRLAARALATQRRFAEERTRWTPQTPRSQMIYAGMQLTESTRKADRALVTARWPRQVTRLVRSSVAAAAAFLEQVRPPVRLTVANFTAWNLALTELSLRAGRAASKLRLALGLSAFGSAVERAQR